MLDVVVYRDERIMQHCARVKFTDASLLGENMWLAGSSEWPQRSQRWPGTCAMIALEASGSTRTSTLIHKRTNRPVAQAESAGTNTVDESATPPRAGPPDPLS
jgi:hypothetical protein